MPLPKSARALLAVVPLAAAVAAALTLSTGAGARTTAPARSLSPGTDVNVSKLASNESETSIAVNPTDPDNIVITSNVEFGSGIFEAHTTNGGGSWTTQVIADGDNLGSACCDGQAVFDEFGNYFLVFLNDDATDVVLAKSVDGGATFTLVGVVKSGAPRAGGALHPRVGPVRAGTGVDQPSIDAGDGSVWVSYTSEDSESIEARGAQVTALGTVDPFGPVQVVPGSKIMAFGDTAVGPGGQVMVVYQNNRGDEGPDTIAGNLDPDGLGPLPFGKSIKITKTNVGDFDFIPPQNGRSIDAEANLAWDRSNGPHGGRLYLAYADETKNESSDVNLFVRTSDDSGLHWSAPLRVNDDATTHAQFLQNIAVDQASGRVAMAWHDARNVAADDAQFWGAVSTDGGASWNANQQISDGTSNAAAAGNGIDYGDYTAIDFRDGRWWAAWADNSNSTGDNPDGTRHQLDIYTDTSCEGASVTTSTGGPGSGSVGKTPAADCGSLYSTGDPATVTATPGGGNTLLGWFGDAGGTCNPIDVATTGFDTSVSAFFTNVAGQVDDDGTGVSYDGWSFGHQASPCGDYLASSGPKQTLLYPETSTSDTAIKLHTWAGPDQGIMEVKVDGKKTTLDLYAASSVPAAFTIGGLKRQPHKIQLTATGKKNDASGGTQVRLDRIETGGSVIEENNPSWVINKDVTVESGSGTVVGLRDHVVAKKGHQVIFAFNGTQVGLRFLTGPDRGIVSYGDVSGAPLTFDTYSASPGSVEQTLTLAPGTHTIVMESTGKKNPASSGVGFGFDGYRVIS